MKLFLPFLLLLSTTMLAQTPPGLSLIRETDIKKDVYDISAPFFKGRGGGTIDELNASVWLAEKFRTLGIKPAGDQGTYFQYFNFIISLFSKFFVLLRAFVLKNIPPFMGEAIFACSGFVARLKIRPAPVVSPAAIFGRFSPRAFSPLR